MGTFDPTFLKYLLVKNDDLLYICLYTMTSTYYNGRLGNQIIRNLAVSLIAEKHNLRVDYCNNEVISELGINLFSGTNTFNDTIILNDDNYFSVYNSTSLTHNLDPNNSFFQTKEISHLLYNYLRTYKIKLNIIDKNPFNNRYNTNNDLYIHIRLGDVAQYSPGINYYMNAIKTIVFDNLYISTDDPTHDIVKQIIHSYPATKILDYNEILTIQFASTCKNIVLSHGSFSALIGYLSFFSKINYHEYEESKMWYGDLFSINNWIKHSTN
jgi:hypothetical protein